MSERPTEIAREQAMAAANNANAALLAQLNKGKAGSYESLTAEAIQHLAMALGYLATGMRATYILLEKIEQQQRTGRP